MKKDAIVLAAVQRAIANSTTIKPWDINNTSDTIERARA